MRNGIHVLSDKLMTSKIKNAKYFQTAEETENKDMASVWSMYPVQFTSRYDPSSSASLADEFETNHHKFPKRAEDVLVDRNEASRAKNREGKKKKNREVNSSQDCGN